MESLLRSSQNKYYRQGIANETTLADGFPKKKEDLFAYSGIVLGSIESTFFNQADQLEMIVDFVKERGGGFLMLGGKNSFSAGRYQNTPIADILPVELLPDRALPVIDKVKLELTDYGRTHNLMRLSGDPATNNKIWAQLPPLEDFNRVGDVKPGGVVLARGEPENSSGNPILLAYQRYGRGRVDGVHHRKQLALADGDGPRRPDLRAVLEADAALACQRVSGSGHRSPRTRTPIFRAKSSISAPTLPTRTSRD